MKDVRIPGFAWAIGIIVAVALIHSNAATIETWHVGNFYITPIVLDTIVALLIGYLKKLNLGTEQLEDALDVIEQLQNANARAAMERESGGALPRAPLSVSPIEFEKIPKRPNHTARWLVG
jgi:hypothetical protein